MKGEEGMEEEDKRKEYDYDENGDACDGCKRTWQDVAWNFTEWAGLIALILICLKYCKACQ